MLFLHICVGILPHNLLYGTREEVANILFSGFKIFVLMLLVFLARIGHRKAVKELLENE
jgi:hypothetical protein